MRVAAKNLLDRLGKADFAYKEFEDRFTELELWPILEALLRDPRLQAIDRAETTVAMAPEHNEAAPLVSSEPMAGLFSRYGRNQAAGLGSDTPSKPPAQDVRAMLRYISELASKGEI